MRLLGLVIILFCVIVVLKGKPDEIEDFLHYNEEEVRTDQNERQENSNFDSNSHLTLVVEQNIEINPSTSEIVETERRYGSLVMSVPETFTEVQLDQYSDNDNSAPDEPGSPPKVELSPPSNDSSESLSSPSQPLREELNMYQIELEIGSSSNYQLMDGDPRELEASSPPPPPPESKPRPLSSPEEPSQDPPQEVSNLPLSSHNNQRLPLHSHMVLETDWEAGDDQYDPSLSSSPSSLSSVAPARPPISVAPGQPSSGQSSNQGLNSAPLRSMPTGLSSFHHAATKDKKGDRRESIGLKDDTPLTVRYKQPSKSKTEKRSTQIPVDRQPEASEESNGNDMLIDHPTRSVPPAIQRKERRSGRSIKKRSAGPMKKRLPVDQVQLMQQYKTLTRYISS